MINICENYHFKLIILTCKFNVYLLWYWLGFYYLAEWCNTLFNKHGDSLIIVRLFYALIFLIICQRAVASV